MPLFYCDPIRAFLSQESKFWKTTCIEKSLLGKKNRKKKKRKKINTLCSGSAQVDLKPLASVGELVIPPVIDSNFCKGSGLSFFLSWEQPAKERALNCVSCQIVFISVVFCFQSGVCCMWSLHRSSLWLPLESYPGWWSAVARGGTEVITFSVSVLQSQVAALGGERDWNP